MRMPSARSVVSTVGIVMGLGGASHGPGEMLQGNIAPNGIMIEAWPSLTQLGGEPAMTIVPSFLITGFLSVVFGLAVAVWAAAFVHRKNGGPILILLSILMLLFGGGLVPPVIVVVDGIIGTWINRSSARQHMEELTHG